MSDINLGKCWAAVRDDYAVGTISMTAPADVDFDLYRQRAHDCLSLLGEVKSGELLLRSNSLVFVKRNTHARRGKMPRPTKEYPVR